MYRSYNTLHRYKCCNFVKISRQIKMFSMQALYSDRSVNLTAICYSHPICIIFSEISLLPNCLSIQALDSDRSVFKLSIWNLTPMLFFTKKLLICRYGRYRTTLHIHRRTDGRTWLNQLSLSYCSFMYTCYRFSDVSFFMLQTS